MKIWDALGYVKMWVDDGLSLIEIKRFSMHWMMQDVVRYRYEQIQED